MKIPAIRKANLTPTISDLIEAVEILTGRRGNSTIDYGTIDKTRTQVLNIIDLCKMGKCKARAYRNAAFDVVNDWSKVPFDTKSFDTLNVIDLGDSRIIPTLSGYYTVNAQVSVESVPDGEKIIAGIKVNGEYIALGSYVSNGSASHSRSMVSDIIYLNGTTDYVELFVYNSTTTLSIYGGYSYHNYISLIGPF